MNAYKNNNLQLEEKSKAKGNFWGASVRSFVILLAANTLLMGETNATTVVVVKVTVIAAPACVINDNKTIEINFNEVVTTRVDGGAEYLKPVDYSLACKDAPSDAMKIMVDGVATNFNNSALQTNIADLGIELHANGKKLAISKWINFTYPNKPTLEVVPVKRNGIALTTGAFTAGATLKVEYQ